MAVTADIEYSQALWDIASGKIFYGLGPGDEPAIKKIFDRYSMLVHPDKRPGNAEAHEAFIELDRQRKAALLICKPPVFSPFSFRTRKGEYKVTELKHKGSLATVYRASMNGTDIILKVPHTFHDNDLMKAEYDAFKLVEAFDDHIFESFYILDENKKRKSVTAFTNIFGDDYVTVGGIIKEYPYGVCPRIMAFIFNRVLTCLQRMHSSGLRHGAVTPNHILINYRTHGGFLIDWTNAGAPGTKLISRDNKYSDYFPPEFPYHGYSADIYSAAKSMVYLLGGNPKANTVPESVPDLIRSFLNRCLQPNVIGRYRNASFAYDAFQQTIFRVFGPKKFVDLKIPNPIK